jgi:hypothetical protein
MGYVRTVLQAVISDSPEPVCPLVKPVHDFAEIVGAVEVEDYSEEWIRVGRAR